jgi:outer membrane protein TolC
MFGLVGQLGSAAAQVAQTAGEEQLIEAQQVLKDAQRALYRILAREEPEDLAPPTTEA